MARDCSETAALRAAFRIEGSTSCFARRTDAVGMRFELSRHTLEAIIANNLVGGRLRTNTKMAETFRPLLHLIPSTGPEEGVVFFFDWIEGQSSSNSDCNFYRRTKIGSFHKQEIIWSLPSPCDDDAADLYDAFFKQADSRYAFVAGGVEKLLLSQYPVAAIGKKYSDAGVSDLSLAFAFVPDQQREVVWANASAPIAATMFPVGKTVTVTEETTLRDLAEKYLGSAEHWRALWEFNAALVTDPTKVPAGSTLAIPALPSMQWQPFKNDLQMSNAEFAAFATKYVYGDDRFLGLTSWIVNRVSLQSRPDTVYLPEFQLPAGNLEMRLIPLVAADGS